MRRIKRIDESTNQKHKWGETINRFHPIFYSKDQPTVPSLSPFIRVHLRSSADNNAPYPHPPQYDHPQAPRDDLPIRQFAH